jgi:DNA-directed RNA polymerase subunit RPC12/RpoP
MDTGIWTLKCQHCNATFQVELKPNERIIKQAQSTACPNCNVKPESEGYGVWHHIIGFRETQKPAKFSETH